MTRPVVVSAAPLTATWPPLVMVQALPAASVIAALEPASTTVLLGDATGAGVGVGTGTGVGVGVGAGVGVGVAGSGLTDVPAAGDQPEAGAVSPHHRLLVFSCQMVPLTKASSFTPAVVVS